MQNDEREKLDRRVNDQWARRMRALEREFERADRGRHPRPVRHSIPLAILSGAVVILTAVLILVTTRGGPAPEPVAAPPPLGPFGTTPAVRWSEPLHAIALQKATRTGGFSARAVAAALDNARSSLVAARAPGKFLAPGNKLAAPVRAQGAVTYKHVAKSRRGPEQLVVSVNVVWAYALQADYPLASGPGEVAAVHERAEFRFSAGARPPANARPVKDELLWFDADCGYQADQRVGLPRGNDPGALPGYSNGVSVDQAFDLDTTVEVSGHVCRSN